MHSPLQTEFPIQDVQALRAGDPEAIERFTEIFVPRLYHIAYRMCHDPEKARDVAQETLSIALEKMDQFRGDARLITWLYAIMFHECMRYTRQERRYYPLIERVIAKRQLISQERVMPEDVAIAEEQKRIFWDAVHQLPQPLRSVYLLREVEGLSVRETALALGISEANVKVRLHRARRKLREYLQQLDKNPRAD